MNDKYKDIYDMPHHVSDRHPHMSIKDRAAQFGAFAAVAGHSEAVEKASKENSNITDDTK